jgi:hypothetical protein
MNNNFPARFLAGLLVWTAMIFAGCNRHQPTEAAHGSVPPADSAEAGKVTANPAAATPRIAPVTVAPAGADPGPMLAQMTLVVRKFAVERRQVPKSLNDLVAAGYLAALPPAPAGKQFAIQPKHLEVFLQNR